MINSHKIYKINNYKLWLCKVYVFLGSNLAIDIWRFYSFFNLSIYILKYIIKKWYLDLSIIGIGMRVGMGVGVGLGLGVEVGVGVGIGIWIGICITLIIVYLCKLQLNLLKIWIQQER